MEAKIIYDWDEFQKEFGRLDNPKFYINLDTSDKGNVLRIYAETDEVILIFEPEDMDLRKWKKKLDDINIEYKWGESPVRIIENEE
ncbi:MAG: hypothetical protein J7K73_03575 [Nanoarchaeota archaeon]|nr:hypothetical protein [Nanoarchaeota archaeon]